MCLPRYICGAASIGVALITLLAEPGCGNGGVDSTNQPPTVPDASTVNGAPGADADGMPLGLTLRWQSEDPEGQALTYDLYFGESPLPELMAGGLDVAEYELASLEYATTYYWRVVACDPAGLCTPSPRWRFTTLGSAETPAYNDPAVAIVGEVGQFFRIELPADLGQHRMWSWIEPIDRNMLDLIEQTFRTDDDATMQVWLFRSLAIGRTTLSLRLLQEGSTAPLDVAHFELIIY